MRAVAIAELAAQQHGVVSRRQLIAAGAGRDSIHHRISSKRLHRIHAGIYAVGQPKLTREGRYLAAVRACGDGAVLSHKSAAALLGLLPVPSGAIDVTVPHGSGRIRNGIAIHEARSLTADQVTSRDGIPCSSVARTLLRTDEAPRRPRLHAQ